jgi:hypothetical protein
VVEVEDSKIAEETTEVAEIYAEVTATQEAGHPQEELIGSAGTTPHLARLHAEGTIPRAQGLLVASPQATTVAVMKEPTFRPNIDTLN